MRTEMNGFMLVKTEAVRANKLEKKMLDNVGEWYNCSHFCNMLGHKADQRRYGHRHYQVYLTLLKMMIYYQKDHPNGYTMEHRRFSGGDFFRIVKVGTEE